MANIFDDKSVLNRNKIYEIPEGTLILKEGEINLDMYKIVSDHVEMYTGYGTDDEVLIGILGPGTCFGEFGILTGQPAIYTIITYSKTKILRVTEGLMGDFIQENHEDILQIMRNMANSMMKMQHQIYQLHKELNEKELENKELKTKLNVDLVNDNTEDYIEMLRKEVKDEMRRYALYNMESREEIGPKMRFINRK